MKTESIAGFRLSPQQEHLVAVSSEEGYPVSAGLFLCHGPLEASALRDAIGAVVARHEILRTVFRKPRELKLPLQVILDADQPYLQFEDLSGLPAGERESALHARFNEIVRGRSKASDAPVLSATLFRLAEEEHALLVAISSLCADAVSFLVLADELRLDLLGKTPDGELIQYADVTEWQHDLLDAPEDGAEGPRAFWRNQVHQPLVLPLEAEGASGGIESLRIGLAPEDAAELGRMAENSGVRQADILLAAWHVLLHRMTGDPRTVVLAGSAGREYDEIKNAIGLFSRYLPVALEYDGKSRFDEVLSAVTAAANQARDKQDWFEPGSAAASPAIGFEYLDLRADGQSGSVTIFPVAVLATTEALKLRLIATGLKEGLRLDLEYDSARYSLDSIKQLGDSYARVLAQVIEEPRLPLESLSLLTAAGKEAMLARGTGAAVAFPTSPVHALISAQSLRSRGAWAVRSGAEGLTYGELESRSNRLARYLVECGVKRGSLVGLCVSRSAAMMVPVLAILKAGGAYVPLSADQPKARTAQQLGGIRVLVTEAQFVGSLPEFAGGTVVLDGSPGPWEQLSDGAVDVEVTGDDLAYVIYTSGSTGTPKGVGVRHSNLVNYATHIVRALELDGEPLKFATVSTLAADLGNTVIYPALLTGGCLHVLPFDVATDGRRMAAYQAEHGIDVLKIVPSHLGALLDGAAGVLPKRFLIAGGEALKPALVERIRAQSGCEVVNHYGPTETTVGSLMLRLKGYDCAGMLTVPIGRPIANTRAYVLDRNRELLPVGVAGELYIAGAGVSAGYVGQAEKTAERFVADPFHAGERMYRTGDLVRWLAGGVIEFLGRADDQVKIRGYRVELGEIEAVLASVAGVRQCVVIARGRAEDGDDKQVVAYAVLDRQQGATAESLKQALKERLPDYMVPAAIVEMSKLPLTANGKVDRKALPAPEERAAREYKAPATVTEELVAQIWAEVLKVDRISTDENFFDLGGHSLLATQVVSRVRRLLEVDLPLRAMFETPTVGQIAERIEAARMPGGAEAAPQIVRVERNGALPLSFAQQRLWILDQMEPNNPMYNIPRSMRLRGKLDAAALAKSLNEIVRRHEPLRTWFGTEAGEPVQHIELSLELAVTELDLSDFPAAEIEARAKAIVAEEGYRPFNLSRAPLLRAMLLKLGAEEHVLILIMHHIVSDAWSADVFMQELSALYGGFASGRPTELPELTIQYADYAAWQRNWLQGETLSEQLAFWRDQLAGAPPLLLLPADRARPEKQTFAGDLMKATLPADVCGPLKAICRTEGVTLFMALLAGYQVLLSRLSGQEQVVVGTDSANRFSLETERMIGFFINLMPLKLDLSGDPDFLEVLKRVRATTLACYGHQEVPFDKIVEELRPERTLSHNPIVQVLFVMQNAPSEKRQLGAVEVSAFSLPITRSKFDVAVFAVERADSVDCFWVYSTELFDSATAANMAEMFETLLRDALTNPEMGVSLLKLVSEEQKKRIKEERLERRQSSKKKLLGVEVKAIGAESGSKE
jgi:amino acid adenylation domain-containing protein